MRQPQLAANPTTSKHAVALSRATNVAKLPNKTVNKRSELGSKLISSIEVANRVGLRWAEVSPDYITLDPNLA